MNNQYRTPSLQRRSLEPLRRAGSISMLSVLAILAASVCVALVVNSAWMTRNRQNNQQCAEAAALAGCRTLLSDDMLRRNPQEFEIKGRIEQCKDAAINISRRYQSGHNDSLIDRDNIEIGYQAGNAQEGSYPILSDTLTPNYVAIKTGTKTTNRQSSGLMMANATPNGFVSTSAFAVARLDNNIKGFKASSTVPIPIAPFAIPDLKEQTVAGCWSTEIESSDGQDTLAWLSGKNHITKESDRIPEIILTLKKDQLQPVAGYLIPVEFASCQKDDRRSHDVLLRTGFNSQDFLYPTRPMLQFPCKGSVSTLQDESQNTLAAGFQELVGKVRIFPIILIGQIHANEKSDQQSNTVTFERPVAARIMHVDSKESETRIVLQPCVLSTSTAIVTANGNLNTNNPYIWKIRLAH